MFTQRLSQPVIASASAAAIQQQLCRHAKTMATLTSMPLRAAAAAMSIRCAAATANNRINSKHLHSASSSMHTLSHHSIRQAPRASTTPQLSSNAASVLHSLSSIQSLQPLIRSQAFHTLTRRIEHHQLHNSRMTSQSLLHMMLNSQRDLRLLQQCQSVCFTSQSHYASAATVVQRAQALLNDLTALFTKTNQKSEDKSDSKNASETTDDSKLPPGEFEKLDADLQSLGARVKEQAAQKLRETQEQVAKEIEDKIEEASRKNASDSSPQQEDKSKSTTKVNKNGKKKASSVKSDKDEAKKVDESDKNETDAKSKSKSDATKDDKSDKPKGFEFKIEFKRQEPGKDGEAPKEIDPRVRLFKALMNVLAFITFVSLMNFLFSGGSSSREMSFQEFRNRFLATQSVSALHVDPHNKTVHVWLKPAAAARLLQEERERLQNARSSGIHFGKQQQQQNTEQFENDTNRASSAQAQRTASHADKSHDSNIATTMQQQATQVSDDQMDSSSSDASASAITSKGMSVQSDGVETGFYFHIGSVESFERQLTDAQAELNIPREDFVRVRYVSHDGAATAFNVVSTLVNLAFMGAIGFAVFKMVRSAGGSSGGGGGMSNIFKVGKSPATKTMPGEMTKITFKDVAGLDDAKVEVVEFVKFLQAPDKFTKLGAKIPKGALLCGPPGTGKTLLAKAMAGESGVPFFSTSGSEFQNLFVGVGPSRVRDLFAEARKVAPCIVFIDEIDAIGKSRGGGRMGGGNEEREATLNALLVEMDGFHASEGIVVLAATNRADVLDSALLRPGRFDRKITIDKPDIKGRTQIFLVHLKPITITHDANDLASRLAALTPGFAGADIANLCNEAALIAARKDKSVVELVDFEAAADRVIGGLAKSHNVMSAAEKKLVAYHEAGHAVVGWFLEHADPLLKVTIVPRGNGALGFAQYLPKELSLYHEDQLSDMMAMALGGRAAEQVFFTRVSTGASDDLKKVTRIAQATVSIYGMNDKLGNISYAQRDDEAQFTKPFSEATAQTIDEEVRKIVRTTYERTIQLVTKHKAQVQALAEKLIEMETINHDVIVSVLGARPFTTDAYTEWMKHSKSDHDAQKIKDAEKAAGQEDDKTKSKNEESQTGGPQPVPVPVPVPSI